MNLELVVRKRDYYDAAPLWVRNIWSTRNALDHFIKYNRRELTSSGAIVKIGRDYFVEREQFPFVARTLIGQGLVESVSPSGEVVT
jgi:hypothetical protein